MKPQYLMDQVTKELGFESIQISSANGIRWILHERPNIGPEMIKIATRLKEITGKPIDLRLLPKQDKNKRFDRNYLRGVEKLESSS